MKNTSYILVISMVFNSVFAFNSAIAAEVVKGAGAAAVKSLPGETTKLALTEEETKMGGQQPPFAACSGMILVEEDNYKKNQAYWKARETKCDAAKATCNLKPQVIANRGITASRTNKTGAISAAVPMGVFLESVRQRANAGLVKGVQDKSTLIADCSKSSSKSCDASLAAIKARVAKELPAARISWAMMSVPDSFEVRKALRTVDFSSVTGVPKYKSKLPKPVLDVSGLVNAQMKGIMGVPGTPPLSDAEQAKVKAIYTELAQNALVELQNLKSANPAMRGLDTELSRLFNGQIQKRQAFELTQLSKAISRAPELAFLGNANAPKAEVVKAVASVKDSLQSSIKETNAAIPAKEQRAERVSEDALKYAGFTALIEKMLVEEQAKGGASSCAVATSALYQLQDVKGKNGLVAGGVVAVVSIGAALAPWAAGAVGVGVSAGAATAATNFAIASGLVGGLAMTGVDVAEAVNASQLADAGLMKREDAYEAANSAAIGGLLTPLDFMGGGALFGAAIAGGAKLASRSASPTLSRFGAAALAKQEKKAAELAKDLATKAAAATAPNASADTVAQAQAALTKFEQMADAEGKKLLGGRTATAVDEETFGYLAKGGFLGDMNRPNVDVMKEYADYTKGMSQDEIKYLGEQIKKVTDAAGPIKSSAKDSAETVARNKEISGLVLAVANTPNPAAVAEILKPNSGWNSQSLAGMKAVFTEMKKYAKGKAKQSSEVVAANFKKAYAKLSGKPVDSPEVQTGCGCSGVCTVKVATTDALELSEPRYLACVAH